jgi:hypothetical protein
VAVPPSHRLQDGRGAQAQADRGLSVALFQLGGREIPGSLLWIGVISPTRRCRSTAASLTQAREASEPNTIQRRCPRRP